MKNSKWTAKTGQVWREKKYSEAEIKALKKVYEASKKVFGQMLVDSLNKGEKYDFLLNSLRWIEGHGLNGL